MSRLPSILRRQLRLHQARRALLRGAPEEALGILRDPCLLLSSRADWMRSRTLEVLCRRAQERADEGRDASTARLLAMVDSEDPERADRLRRRLHPAGESAGAQEGATLEAMRQLLADLRQEGVGPQGGASSEASPTVPEEKVPAAARRAEGLEGRSTSDSDATFGRLVRLAVDDGGESLLASGTEFVLGHLRSESADLPFLADIEREHARLTRVESFHGGTRWCLEAGGAVELDGRTIQPTPDSPDARVTLSDGQEVRLARNLAFRFRLPDPSSSSAALELLHGAECLGVGRVLLCVPGEGGRLRIGPGRDRHIGVGALAQDLELRFDAGRLVLRCGEGLRTTTPVEGASTDGVELSVPWPLPLAIDLAVGQASSKGPPFGVALRPVAEPRPRPPIGPESAGPGQVTLGPVAPGEADPDPGASSTGDDGSAHDGRGGSA